MRKPVFFWPRACPAVTLTARFRLKCLPVKNWRAQVPMETRTMQNNVPMPRWLSRRARVARIIAKVSPNPQK